MPFLECHSFTVALKHNFFSMLSLQSADGSIFHWFIETLAILNTILKAACHIQNV